MSDTPSARLAAAFRALGADLKRAADEEVARYRARNSGAYLHLVRVHAVADRLAGVLADVVRFGTAIERYYQAARALGVDRATAQQHLDAAARELAESRWWFDPVEDAHRRLMEVHVALRPLPPEHLRDAARKQLMADGRRFTPADVDRYARTLASLCAPAGDA